MPQNRHFHPGPRFFPPRLLKNHPKTDLCKKKTEDFRILPTRLIGCSFSKKNEQKHQQRSLLPQFLRKKQLLEKDLRKRRAEPAEPAEPASPGLPGLDGAPAPGGFWAGGVTGEVRLPSSP